MTTTKAAIIGSGNIGTDLMIKMRRRSEILETAVLVGVDPHSDGLRRARRLGVATTHEGIDGLLDSSSISDIEIVFDATSADAHVQHARALEPLGKRLVDLTPAAVGPFVVPAVNLDEQRTGNVRNVNMVTCGGQATIPVVAAVSQVAPVAYAEIVASIASRSAGPGTRANIDEFTETTARAIEQVGGAARGKAVIVLNPAEPPVIMRDTVHCLVGDVDEDAVRASVARMAAEVTRYVPGYRIKQEVQFTPVQPDEARTLLPAHAARVSTRVSIFLEVEGAAHYLPAYAGNLDIMTSAALHVGEHLAGQAAADDEKVITA